MVSAPVVNIGALPNDGSGDVDREAFRKLNEALALVLAHIRDAANPHAITARQVGAYSADETDEIIRATLQTIPTLASVATAISTAISALSLGTASARDVGLLAGNVPALDSNKRLSAQILPDDVVRLVAGISGPNITLPGLVDALDLGTASTKDVGLAASNVVQLDTSARLPAVDASQLLNLPGTNAAPLDDYRTLAIQFARTLGSALALATSLTDDFVNQVGYDTTNSVNVAFDNLFSIVGNFGQTTVEDLAAMTSNTAPAGQTATATGNSTTGNEAFRAYDKLTGTLWRDTANATGTISRTTATARVEGAYAVTAGSATGAPQNWTRWGSNDGGLTRTTINTVTAQTGWAAGQKRTFTVPAGNRGNYKTYGLTITANNGATGLDIVAIESLSYLTGPMDLRSIALGAQFVPARGGLFFLVKATADTIAANTNLVASLSRNGGMNFTPAALTSTGTLLSGFTVYEANNIDLTGQPPGATMQWRLQTVGTALNVQVDAARAEWG